MQFFVTTENDAGWRRGKGVEGVGGMVGSKLRARVDRKDRTMCTRSGMV